MWDHHSMSLERELAETVAVLCKSLGEKVRAPPSRHKSIYYTTTN